MTARDEGAERHVLGAILAAPEVLPSVMDILTPQDFWHNQHRAVFAVMVKLDAAGVKAEPTAVVSELVSTRQIKTVPAAYVMDLYNELPVAVQATYHAQRIADLASVRRLAEYAQKVTQLAQSPELTPTDMIDRAEGWLADIGTGRAGEATLNWEQTVTAGFDAIERAGEAADSLGIPSGLPDLDRLTHGFRPGTVTVVAGRPASGKSVMLMNVAAHAALKAGVPTLVLSLEMSVEDLYMRLASATCQIDLGRLVKGTPTDDDWVRMSRHAGETAEAPLWIDGTAGVTMADIRSKARRMTERHGLRLLVVDYLQLIATGRTENRQVAVAEISRGLKLLAAELGIAVIVAAQMNRAVEMRGDKQPQLSDLRESGALEADADAILFVHREDASNPQATRRGEADLILAKNRNGSPGQITVAAQLQFARFVSMEPEPSFTADALSKRNNN